MAKQKPVLSGSDLTQIPDKHYAEITKAIPEGEPLTAQHVFRLFAQQEENKAAYSSAVQRVARTKGRTAALGGDMGLIEFKKSLLAKTDQIDAEFEDEMIPLLQTSSP